MREIGPKCRALAAFFLLATFVACAPGDPCENEIKESIASPDGKHVATAFIRGCGATTGFSPQVHLGPTGEPPSKTGNVFIGTHSDRIKLNWISNTNLVIY